MYIAMKWDNFENIGVECYLSVISLEPRLWDVYQSLLCAHIKNSPLCNNHEATTIQTFFLK